MTNSATLGSFGDASNAPLVFRNKIINGGFDIWQRGTSQTSSGYGSDDRWNNVHSGSTKTASQQTFTVGQTDVPANPRYWSRTVVSSVAGASNYVLKQQRIENVSTMSGQTATLSFWAKADASKNIAVEFVQIFGTGGSPSADVIGIGVTTFALTTSWKYFTVTVSIPSISGKTLGTNNDHYLGANFWFDGGSTFNARTNSLGQQSGTFDIAQVQLEAGLSATPFEQRPIWMELSLCQRYYFRVYSTAAFASFGSGFCGNTTAAYALIVFPVYMRTFPTSIETTGSAADYDINYLTTASTLTSVPAFSVASNYVAKIDLTTSAVLTAGQGAFFRGKTTSTYIGFSAEL